MIEWLQQPVPLWDALCVWASVFVIANCTAVVIVFLTRSRR